MLAYSEACERNKDPILEILQAVFTDSQQVLEIGSGTGQHAVYFAQAMPQLNWLSSDVADNLPSINARISQANLSNLSQAIELDVCQENWPIENTDAIFSANVLHIVSEQQVQCFFHGVGNILNSDGQLCVYGPFKYNGEFTTASNANFNVWLKNRDPLSGVRDFEWVNELATQQGLQLQADHAMPANNQLLIWRKT